MVSAASSATRRRAARIALIVLGMASLADAGRAVAPSEGAAVGLTPEKLLSDYAPERPVLPTATWLADSRHILVSLPGEPGSNAANWIERVDVKAGKRERLVAGENPVAAPDGSAFAYLAPIAGGYRLETFDLRTGQPHEIATLPPGQANWDISFSWSANARYLAYSFQPARPKPAETGGAAKSSVRIIGGAGDLPEPSEIWIADTVTGGRRKIYAAHGTIADIAWAPDGKAIIASNVRLFELRDNNAAGVVLRISTETGEATTIVRNLGVQDLQPSLSNGGGSLAFKLDPANQVYPYFWNIATVSSAGGTPRQLTHDLYVGYGSPRWTPDGRLILFTCKRAVFTQICSVTPDGVLKTLTAAQRNASRIAIAPSGKAMAWTSLDAFGRSEIRMADIDGGHEKMVLDAGPDMAGVALGDVEEVHWNSPDGLGIVGLLIKPVHYRPGMRYPMIVDLHGGPVGGVSLSGSLLNSSPMEWQMWAAKGYAVFVPDYRDSAIAGWAAILQMREHQDYNARDTDDIMAGVDAMIARGIADPDRLALIGHSKGGFMVNWILTQTNRFKAAVSYEGWIENYISYGSSQRLGGNSILEWRFKGKPWDAPENYARNGAVNYVKGVKTPTLFIAGDYGAQSGVENLFSDEFMYTAWKQQNVPAKMLIYRNEGHVVSRPENQRDLLTQSIDWIERWIGG